MVLLSIVGLVRTIGIIVLIYGLWRLMSKYVFPFMLRWFVGKAQQKMQEQMKAQHQQFGRKKEAKTVRDDGKVKITKDKEDSSKNKTQNSQDDFGEYVDFEEV